MRVHIQDRGPGRIKTNYWNSDMERASRYYCALSNQEAELQLLIPRKRVDIPLYSANTQHVEVSIGPWPEKNTYHAIQFLFEDYGEKPQCLVLDGCAGDTFPRELTSQRSWMMSVWILRDEKPHRFLYVPCKHRRSRSLPDFSPFDPLLDVGFRPSAFKQRMPVAAPTKPIRQPYQPTNIIGLPRILEQHNCERLLQLMELDSRNARAAFMLDPLPRRWARSCGLGGAKPTQELIRRCHADRRYRYRALDEILQEGKVRCSLERNVLLAHFKPVIDDPKLNPQALHDTLLDLDDAQLWKTRLDAAIANTDLRVRGLWMAWPMICEKLRCWPQLTPQEQEPAVLGVFVLLTLCCSLDPIALAQRFVPELEDQFASLRVVCLRPKRFLPGAVLTQQDLDYLWRKQQRRLLRSLYKLRSIDPSVAALAGIRAEIIRAAQLDQSRVSAYEPTSKKASGHVLR